MALDSALLSILACPKCKGELSHHKAPARLVCAACKLAYPIRDEIPVMLIDEATPVS
jgi:uncharacterized protein YbaR (Trm112 family)